MKFETITFQREDDLVIITLNRPAQLNALEQAHDGRIAYRFYGC